MFVNERSRSPVTLAAKTLTPLGLTLWAVSGSVHSHWINSARICRSLRQLPALEGSLPWCLVSWFGPQQAVSPLIAARRSRRSASLRSPKRTRARLSISSSVLGFSLTPSSVSRALHGIWKDKRWRHCSQDKHLRVSHG